MLDTSVVIDLEHVDADALPDLWVVSAITIAELAAGANIASTSGERAARQETLQRLEATFDPWPFDVAAARAYGRMYVDVAAKGRKPRGGRAVDLMIAASAAAAALPLFTRNPADFAGLGDHITVIAV
jgi:predicted nucleic acid-binding protein